MADHRTASCSVLMMPEEHSNDSACSHEQQSLLCTTIVSLHLSAVPVSHSRASVLAVGPRAQIFPCPWNLFILCAVDFPSSIMLCYCCQWTAAHSLSSCFFLLSLLSHLLPCSNCWNTKQRKTVKCLSLNCFLCFLMCLWDLQTTVVVFIRKPIFGMTQTKTVRTCKCFVDITKTLCLWQCSACVL